MINEKFEKTFSKITNSKTKEYYENLTKIRNKTDSSTIADFALYTPINSIQRFLARYELIKMIKDIPGSIIELGVFNGNGLLSLLHNHNVLQPTNIHREFYGFDTFEGFIDIHENDKNEKEEWEKGDFCTNNNFDTLNDIINVHNNYYYIKNKVKLIKGDVAETVPTFLENNKHTIVSLLYLDMDLYEPTKIALKYFLPRMMKGSIIAFDELNCKEFPGETIASLEEMGTKYKIVNLLNSNINYCVIE